MAQPPVDAAIPAELRNQTKYRILRILGRGGMGSVYEALHIRMERKQALKVINPELVDNAEAQRRFDDEIKTVAKLDHPNIARAYDAEAFGALQVIVMEFVQGKTLYELLEVRGRFEVQEACRCIAQACRGLQYAHEQNLVHRDLKPQNLMLSDGVAGKPGIVKILDFGLAKVVSENTHGRGRTKTNMSMGTYEYISPEQALDAAHADIRADIYSLGCTLYYLIAGVLPFPYEAEVKILLAHQSEVPRPLREVRPDVPKALSALVDRMLAKKREDRPQTPAEVAAALSRFAGGTGMEEACEVRSARSPSVDPALASLAAQDTATSEEKTVSERQPRPRNAAVDKFMLKAAAVGKNPITWVALAATVVTAGVVFGLVMALGPKSKEPDPSLVVNQDKNDTANPTLENKDTASAAEKPSAPDDHASRSGVVNANPSDSHREVQSPPSVAEQPEPSRQQDMASPAPSSGGEKSFFGPSGPSEETQPQSENANPGTMGGMGTPAARPPAKQKRPPARPGRRRPPGAQAAQLQANQANNRPGSSAPQGELDVLRNEHTTWTVRMPRRVSESHPVTVTGVPAAGGGGPVTYQGQYSSIANAGSTPQQIQAHLVSYEKTDVTLALDGYPRGAKQLVVQYGSLSKADQRFLDQYRRKDIEIRKQNDEKAKMQ
jgi:serine/threonine protein kinase